MGRSVDISSEIPPPLSMMERLNLSQARKERIEEKVQEEFAKLAVKENAKYIPLESEKTSDSDKKIRFIDPVADFLLRIRNSMRARQQKLDVPATKLKAEIARILKEEGYITSYKPTEENGTKVLRVYLKYGPDNEAVLRDLKRISRPGCRVYLGADEINRVKSDLGVSIVSTPKGLMTKRQAIKEGVLGEILWNIW